MPRRASAFTCWFLAKSALSQLDALVVLMLHGSSVPSAASSGRRGSLLMSPSCAKRQCFLLACHADAHGLSAMPIMGATTGSMRRRLLLALDCLGSWTTISTNPWMKSLPESNRIRTARRTSLCLALAYIMRRNEEARSFS